MRVDEIRAAVQGLDPTAANGELQRRLDNLYQELFNLRFQWSTRQLKNSARLTQVKRDIARVKTVMREREVPRQGGK